MKNIQMIVLEGGPGAGKTSAREELKEKLTPLGYAVLFTPEVATELFSSGVKINDKGIDSYDFQKHAVFMQIEKEKRYRKMAEDMKNDKILIFCDRGRMTSMAYMGEENFKTLIKNQGWNIVGLRDKPYLAVLYLVSPAVDMPQFYTTENNPARQEKTPEKAAAVCLRTRDIWVGHPHLRIIKSCERFEDKMENLFHALRRVLGIPAPLEIERKFLVEPPDFDVIRREYGIRVEKVFIEQIYLKSGEEVSWRIRKRGQDGHFVYYDTLKRDVEAGVRTEEEKRTNPFNYFSLARNFKDKNYDIIRKNRHCFLWNNQYFELDMFLEPARLNGLFLLEIELNNLNEPVDLPPFLGVVRELTFEQGWTNRALARKI